MSDLAKFYQRYESIMAVPPSAERDTALARLMTDMEHHFHIPALQNPTWEQANRATIALYRIVSESRT